MSKDCLDFYALALVFRHQTFFDHPFYSLFVQGAPPALGFAGRESLHVFVVVNRPDRAINPAKAQSRFHRLSIFHAPLAGGRFEHDQPDAPGLRVMRLGPAPPLGARFGVDRVGGRGGHGCNLSEN